METAKLQSVMQKFIIALAVLILSQRLLKRKTRKIEKERVVILGCSSGIGKEIALRYASRGSQLILFARRETLLAKLETECVEQGASRVYYQVGDVTNEQNVERLSEFTKEKLGGVDTVIYCAGMLSVRTFLEASNQSKKETSQALENITTINYFAAVWTAQWFLPLLLDGSLSPNLLIVSSMAGKVGAPTRALYAGSKHALHGFFDSLRVELAGRVHIGLICPGTVDTELRESAVDKSLGQGVVSGSKKNKLSPEKVASRIVQASDYQEREIYLPVWFGYIALWAKLLASPLVDWFAAQKYKK